MSPSPGKWKGKGSWNSKGALLRFAKRGRLGTYRKEPETSRDLGKLHVSIGVCDNAENTKKAWWIKYGYLLAVSWAPNTLRQRLWLCHSPAVFVNSCPRGRALTRGMPTDRTRHYGSLLSYKNGPGEASWAPSSRVRCSLLPTESRTVQIFYFHASSVASVILRFKGKYPEKLPQNYQPDIPVVANQIPLCTAKSKQRF